MESSDEIIDLLESVSARLERLESAIEAIADDTRSLEIQGAAMADDLAEIRQDIARLEPGVI
jgi:predicted  nucleic acid-binding Zn-ribbon protein